MTIILDSMEQGSKEWHEARRGRITMSNAKALITKGRGGAASKTRESYIQDVAAELASGISSFTLNSYDVQRGNLLEEYAVRAYEAEKGVKVDLVGLGYLDEDKEISASPDGIVEKYNKGIEIKCPAPKAHLKTILSGGMPKDHGPQVQGGMWVFEFDEWDFISYCPQFKPMPLVIYNVRRDDEMIKEIATSAKLAVEELKEIMAGSKMRVSGELESICEESLEAMDIIFNDDMEIS